MQKRITPWEGGMDGDVCQLLTSIREGPVEGWMQPF